MLGRTVSYCRELSRGRFRTGSGAKDAKVLRVYALTTINSFDHHIARVTYAERKGRGFTKCTVHESIVSRIQNGLRMDYLATSMIPS